eukprot:TRINITY_DN11462_c0_g1_i1.p1 TRINITY_DN11462_c0_g1~~TRINITY_DN11462_c0_g1_i1.p1  ORF type:complete len:751 (+),score=190.58 TRINITY_DN11462_c0_g1_i1:55-2253(+)
MAVSAQTSRSASPADRGIKQVPSQISSGTTLSPTKDNLSPTRRGGKSLFRAAAAGVLATVRWDASRNKGSGRISDALRAQSDEHDRLKTELREAEAAHEKHRKQFSEKLLSLEVAKSKAMVARQLGDKGGEDPEVIAALIAEMTQHVEFMGAQHRERIAAMEKRIAATTLSHDERTQLRLTNFRDQQREEAGIGKRQSSVFGERERDGDGTMTRRGSLEYTSFGRRQGSVTLEAAPHRTPSAPTLGVGRQPSDPQRSSQSAPQSAVQRRAPSLSATAAAALATRSASGPRSRSNTLSLPGGGVGVSPQPSPGDEPLNPHGGRRGSRGGSLAGGPQAMLLATARAKEQQKKELEKELADVRREHEKFSKSLTEKLRTLNVARSKAIVAQQLGDQKEGQDPATISALCAEVEVQMRMAEDEFVSATAELQRAIGEAELTPEEREAVRVEDASKAASTSWRAGARESLGLRRTPSSMTDTAGGESPAPQPLVRDPSRQQSMLAQRRSTKRLRELANQRRQSASRRSSTETEPTTQPAVSNQPRVSIDFSSPLGIASPTSTQHSTSPTSAGSPPPRTRKRTLDFDSMLAGMSSAVQRGSPRGVSRHKLPRFTRVAQAVSAAQRMKKLAAESPGVDAAMQETVAMMQLPKERTVMRWSRPAATVMTWSRPAVATHADVVKPADDWYYSEKTLGLGNPLGYPVPPTDPLALPPLRFASTLPLPRKGGHRKRRSPKRRL